jgi:hypothetical protein
VAKQSAHLLINSFRPKHRTIFILLQLSSAGYVSGYPSSWHSTMNVGMASARGECEFTQARESEDWTKVWAKLKSPFQFNLSLYLKYNLTFKCEIKLQVLCQLKFNTVYYPLHLNWLKTRSLISHLNVKLYFKYKLRLN